MSRPAAEGARPAAYRDLFALVEYRAVFGASALSWIGDYLYKAAVALLVYDRTGSALASAGAFAISYLPWLVAGPVLGALAERYPARRVMIACDLARTGVFALTAVPGVPVPVLLLLMFAGGLLAPPFEAARSAQLPRILTGDRYALGLSFNNSVRNLSQVGGYAVGGLVAAYEPHVALSLNAGTFLGSALLLYRFVKARPATPAARGRTNLWRETWEGLTVIFGHPEMRAIAFICFGAVAFVIVPEGLAAAWAAELGGGGKTQGLIMAANPLGTAVGGLVLPRLLSPGARTRLIGPLAVLGPLALAPALLDLPLSGVLPLVALAGLVIALLLPSAQARFQQVLPVEYRARAFGVMNTGLQLSQGAAVVISGTLSDHFATSSVIGGWCAAGGAVMLLVTFRRLRTWTYTNDT